MKLFLVFLIIPFNFTNGQTVGFFPANSAICDVSQINQDRSAGDGIWGGGPSVLNQGAASRFGLSISPTQTTPGQEHTITLTRGVGSGGFRGLLLYVADASNNRVGTFTISNGALMQTLPTAVTGTGCANHSSILTHTLTSAFAATQNFTWTAPASLSGPVTVSAIAFEKDSGSPGIYNVPTPLTVTLDPGPTISSIVRQTPTTSGINSSTNPVFRVTFSEGVRNVNTDDFVLNSNVGGTINTVTAVNSSTYDVTVNNLNNANGTLGLKVKGIDGATGSNDIAGIIFSNGTAAHQQATQNDFLNQALLGQSFTAASNNFFTAFTLFPRAGQHSFTGTARLRVFQGDASSAAVLADANAVLSTETINISSSTVSGQTFNISNPTQLTSGSVYSIVLDNFVGSGSKAFNAHTSGSLANGRAFFTNSNNTSHAAFDFMIDIFEGTEADGIALFDQAPGTNESYTLTQVLSPLDKASNAVLGVSTTSSINIASFTAASDADGYVIKARNLGFYSTSPPTNGNSLPSLETYTGSSEKVVYAGTSITPNITLSNLQPNTDHALVIYAYKLNGGNYDFQQVGYEFYACTKDNEVTVTSIVRQTPTDATTDADQVVFRVTFAAAVTNVDATDFALSGTAAGDGTIGNVNAVSATVYDVTVTGVTNSNGTINLDIKGNNGVTGTNNIQKLSEGIQYAGQSSGGTLTGNELGASFVATRSGRVNKALLRVTQGMANATFKIYEGEGFGGTLVGSVMMNVSNAGYLDILGNINLTAGTVYTWSLSHASALTITASNVDDYPNYKTYVDGAEVVGRDIMSEVWVEKANADLATTAPGTDETFTMLNNAAPTATNVSITGTLKSGQQVTGTYTWADADNGDTESGSTFKWYRSDDAAGTGKTEIAGANTVNYTLTNDDINKFISFEVTPNDGTTAGTPVETTRTLVANVFITSIARQTPGDATTNADEVTFRVIFSAGVARLSKDDFALSGTVAGDGTISSITRVNGSTYDVKVTGIDISEGTINLDLKGADGAGTNNIIKANEVRDATNNGNLVQDSGGDTFFWQSFVAEQTGLFHSVTLRKSQHSHTYEGTATLKLYAGEGTGGAELASQQIFTSQSSGDETYYFELPASITQGTQYTWFWQQGTGTGATGFSGQTGNSYGGGRGLSEQFPGATSLDWYFITNTITGALENLGSPAPATDETYTIVNPPEASNVAISGTAVVGQQLTGSYSYSDPQSDAESGTTFRWLRADDAIGTGKVAIPGATSTTYTVTVADAGKFLIFEVTASDGTVIGDATESAAQFIPSLITVQSIARQTPATENVGATSNPVFRVTFSENVSNVTTDDFVLNSTVGGSINSLNAVDAKTYDLTINGLTNADGTLGLKVKGIDGTAGTNDISVTSFENGAPAHQQTTENDFLNQLRIGQSFTAASNNFLTAFTLFAKTGNHTFSGTARLRVFQGDASNSSVLNNANNVLTEETVNITNNTAASGQTFTITTPPQLTSGMAYSVVLDLFNGSGDRAFFAHTSGSLAGGRAFFTGSHNGHAAFDFMIDIFEGTQIVNNLFDQAPGTNESYNVKEIDQTIAFSTTASNGAESTASANLEVALSAAEDVDVTVEYAVTGTATNGGTDFILANGFLTITSGNTTNNITIASIVDDALSEADETVIVTLVNPVNATLGTNTVHTYTINDNDNVAPVASNVAFTGILEVGETLTGSYTYTDAENHAESGTTFKWFASDDANGTGKTAIAGASAQTFVLTTTQLGKFISFEVTPNDGTSAGTAVESTRQGTVKTDQTITFEALADKTYGDAAFGLTAISTSNLAVTYSSSNTGVATVSGSTVTIVGAGKTTITASQAGNTSFKAAKNIVQPLTVGKANLITTPDAKSRTYGDANPAFTIGYTGFVNGEDASVIDTEPIPGTEASATTNVGTADITLAGGSDDNYDFSLQTGTLTITKAALTATADNKSREYGDTNPTLTISYTGFKNGETASVIDTEPTISTVATATTGVGTVDITLTGGSDNNYDLSTLNNGTLTITKATLTATADDKSKTYGDNNPAFTISYTGFKNGEDASVIDAEPAASTAATATTGVGSSDISLAGGTDDNYEFDLNNGTLTINKATLTATPDAKSRVYGDANPAFTVGYTGFVNGEDASVIDTEPVPGTEASATTNVGTADITLAGGSDDNYDFSLQLSTLTITKAALVATADDKSRAYGDANPKLTISYTGFKNDETASVIDTEPTASTAATATTGVGTADISPTGGSDNNYDITTLNKGTLTITKATLTATADDKSKIYGDNNPALTISYTGFKNGEDASVIDTEPTVSTTATAATGVGSAIINLTGGSDDNYDFSLNDGTLTINKATLTATADDKSKTYGEDNPKFSISYTGFVNGEDVSVIDTEPTVSSAATATTDAGSASISLSGGSDDNYDFSLNDGILTIDKVALTATADDKSRAYGDANPVFTISYTGFVNDDDGSVIDTAPDAISKAISTTDVGTVDITLSGGSDNNYDITTLNNGTLTITKATLTATADDKSKTYGDSNPALTISYTGFKNGEDASVIDTEPTVSTTATAATGVGSAIINLTGGSDDNYNLSLNNGTMTINKATLTATADDKSKTYGEDNPAFSISYTGFVNGEDESVIDTEPTVSTTANATTNAGSATISLSGGSDDNYDFSLNDGTLTIDKAALTATADDKSRAYGEANPAFTISYTGFVNKDDASVIDTAPTASTTATSTTGVGTADITLNGGTDNNYEFNTLNKGTLTINKAALTATADDKSRAYGVANPALTISYTGFANGEDASVIDTEPTASSTATTATGVGSTAISLTGGSDDNYDISLNDGTLTINKAALTATADDKSRAYGDTNPAFTISYTGFVNGEDESVIDTEPTATTTATATTGAGTAVISLTGGSDNNYEFTTLNNGTLTISKAALMATADDQMKNEGTTNPELTITYSGFKNGEEASVLDTPPTISTTVDVNTIAGDYVISLTGGTDDNYEISTADGVFTVNPKAAISSVSVPTDGTYQIGDHLDFELIWTRSISITGAPTLGLTLGSQLVEADLQGVVSNSTTAIFRYTIKEGDTDTDGIALAANLSLNGATIVDETSVNAKTDLNNVAVTSGVLVDGIRPTVTLSAADRVDDSYAVTATFSEDVTGFEAADVSLSGATLSDFTTVSNTEFTFKVNGSESSATVQIEAGVSTDEAGNENTASDVLTLNFNSNPTAINLTQSSIDENNEVNDVIGAFTSVDPDASDMHSYTLVAGTGDTDNASFSIDGNELQAAIAFDFEQKASYSLRVETNDGNGGSFAQAFTITINNVNEPLISLSGDLSFDATALGVPVTRQMTVTNEGDVEVTATAMTLPEGFTMNPNSVTVGVGASEEVDVTFTPTEARVYSGDLILSYEGLQASIQVSGEGMIVTSIDVDVIKPEVIAMYPNPASQLLTIDLSELPGKALDIQIINPSGIIVYSREKHQKDSLNLNVSGYRNGMYIVTFTDGKTVARKKLMIKK